MFRSQRRRARPGSRFCPSARRPGRRTWRWTPPTRACSTPRPGRASASPGRSSPGARRAASTRSTDGGDTWRKLGGGLPDGRRRQDRRGGLARRPGPRLGAGRGRGRRAGSTAPTTRGRRWTHTGPTRAAACTSGPGTTCTSSRTPATQPRLRAQRRHLPLRGRRQHLRGDQGPAARRRPRPLDQPERQPPDDHGQRRRRARSRSTAARPGRRSTTSPRPRSTASPWTSSSPTASTAPQQDNSTISMPSRIPPALTPYETGATWAAARAATIAVDPRDPDIVYAGCYGGEITPHEPGHGRGAQHPGVPADGGRPGAAGPALPLPLERARSASRRTTRRCSTTARSSCTARRDEGQTLGGHQPRPLAQPEGQAGLRGGADHLREHRRRGELQHPRLRGVAAQTPGPPLGRQRRRAGARVAGRRRDLAERHAAGPARVGDASRPSSPRRTTPGACSWRPIATGWTTSARGSIAPTTTARPGRS